MKRLFVILGITLALILFTTSSFAELKEDRLDSITRSAVDSTVRIMGLRTDDSLYQICNGVVIKNTLNESIILTAKHCLLKDRNMVVGSLRVRQIGILIGRDLGYIKFNRFIPEKYPAKLSDYMTHSDDKVVAIGYVRDILHVHKGFIFYKTPKDDMAVVDVIPGMSGGGLWNEHGELVGITTSYIPYIKLAYFINLKGLHILVSVNKLLE